jgi:uncharacterized protein (UPF0248 family)
MNKTLTDAQLIPKEEILNLKFPSEDVFTDIEEIKNRNNLVNQASTLGNLEKHKVKIYFSDHEGFKKVHTTIWAVGDKNVSLKSGMNIPIHRIYTIDLLTD